MDTFTAEYYSGEFFSKGEWFDPGWYFHAIGTDNVLYLCGPFPCEWRANGIALSIELSMNLNDELDEFHWHEAIDRTYLLQDTFYSMVNEHPVIRKHPELEKLADLISDKFYELYNSIGSMNPYDERPEWNKPE